MQEYTLKIDITPEIFRAYDIRGLVDEQLCENGVYTLGLAIGTLAQAEGEKAFYVARDGRESGTRLQNALVAGLLTSGCDVTNIGAVPSPLLYFAVSTGKFNSGVMLTGSHNPAQYNGLKIMIAGNTLAADQIQAIHKIISKQEFTSGSGSYEERDFQQEYINTICSQIQLNESIKIVVDCGNGITGDIAPRLFKELGCDVIPLFCEVDGDFPNHHPDPSIPENLVDLQNAVSRHQADLGLAFDGDGDRLGVVTRNGDIIWPDRLLILYVSEILQRKPGATIVYDVKCSAHLPAAIEAAGGIPLICKTGHSFIKRKLKAVDAELGGEMSGHIFFNDRWFGFDDAIYSGARLLELVCKEKQSNTDIFAKLPNSINTPEIKVPIDESHKFNYVERFVKQTIFPDTKKCNIDGVRVEFSFGWGLLRASNTTPNLTLRFEADDKDSLRKIQSLFIEQMKTVGHEIGLSTAFFESLSRICP